MWGWVCLVTRPGVPSSNCSPGVRVRCRSWQISSRSAGPRCRSTCAYSKDGGLVVGRAEGNRRIYRLNPDGVTALRAWLDSVWGEALASFHKAAEAAAVPDREQET